MNSPPTVLDSETSTLFNPAFCAILLNKASKGYEAKAGQPMPVTFTFLILPSALHQPTRDALPSTTASSMWSWLHANPVLMMDFIDRAKALRTFTGAAITYGLQQGALSSTSGAIAAGTLRRRPRTLRPTNDWQACVTAAEFLGKWFGGSGADEATTLARWGVQP